MCFEAIESFEVFIKIFLREGNMAALISTHVMYLINKIED
jgi:hypothetical protein